MTYEERSITKNIVHIDLGFGRELAKKNIKLDSLIGCEKEKIISFLQLFHFRLKEKDRQIKLQPF